MYPEIRETLNILNDDKNHFVNSNDICTPMECVEEMVNAIPEEFWQREFVKILDPCAGNGNFPAYVLEKCIKNNTRHSIIANEINSKRLKNLKKILGSSITILDSDFFHFNDSEKYDLVIANPPYAKFTELGVRAAKNHTLSRDFILKALSITNDNGYIVFIVPDNWMSLSDRNDVVFELSKFQFVRLNIHGAKKYFPGVGSSFTWFVLKKEKNNKSFVVENFYLKNSVDSATLDTNIESIPLFYNDMVRGILNKTIYNNSEKFQIETSSNLHKYTKKKLLNCSMNDSFKYRIIHTQNQTVWSSVPHKYQDGLKVFISTTSYYKTFIDDCGMTQSIAFLRCGSYKEAEISKYILDHPLYVFLNNIHRYGNFNNIRILQKFPIPSNVENIWESFGVSNEEKDFIMSFLKTT